MGFAWARLVASAFAAIMISVTAPSPAAASSHCGDAVRVSPGDTLAAIARYCGTTVGALLAANPALTNPNIIRVGQLIYMPGRTGTRPPAPPGPPAPEVGRCGSSVTVRPGDTLARIAARCGYTVGQLLAANPQIRNPNRIWVGMTVRMPAQGGMQPPRPPFPFPFPFPPDQWEQTIRVTGTVTSEGIECPAVRGDDGRLYTLTGRTGTLRPGDRVRVTGTRAEMSFCQQGITIAVDRLERLDPAPEPEPAFTVTGTLTREGVTCPAMRGDDGRLYTLAGDTSGFGPGDRVRVEGTRAEVSICQQGITINVRRIRPAF